MLMKIAVTQVLFSFLRHYSIDVVLSPPPPPDILVVLHKSPGAAARPHTAFGR